jgi:hypothetical protein
MECKNQKKKCKEEERKLSNGSGKERKGIEK